MKKALGTLCCAACVLLLVETNALAGVCVDHIDCDDADSCTYDLCVDGTCTNTPAKFGDVSGSGGACGPDGVVSINDIISVADAILDSTEGCAVVNVDMAGPAGCGPDGAKDLYDIVAVLEAFTGIGGCCQACSVVCSDDQFCNGVENCEGEVGCRYDGVPCPGQLCDEESDSCTAPKAILSCQLSHDRVLPGEAGTLDIFLQNVDGLSGYQLALDVTRTAGTGEIQCDTESEPFGCLFVNQFEREDYVFLQSPTVPIGRVSDLTIINAKTLVREGVVVGATPAYLGTYAFIVSADAALESTFEFSIRPGGVLLNDQRVPVGFIEDSTCVLRVLPPDCDGNGISDACDFDCGVAGGECDVPGCGQAVDCNENDYLDACDIAEGTSGDCTGNGVPDECETDCDGNGVADVCDLVNCDGNPDCDDCNGNTIPDFCDIVFGDSRDLDNNGVPDECAEPTDATRLFMVRQGLDPVSFPSGRTVANLQASESVTFDIWVQNTREPLRGYQVELDDATGGDAGFVRFDRSPAITNPFLDRTRTDWVHFGTNAVTGLEVDQTARIASAMSSGGVVATAPRYCGEITYTADADACGDFLIDFVNPGSIPGVSGTVLADPDSHALDFVADGVEVRVGNLLFGDVDATGRVDLFDILCVLDGFSGNFEACPLEAVDLIPCGGDERVDLQDILAVLDAFEGLASPCPTGGCGSDGQAAKSTRKWTREDRWTRRTGSAALVTLEPRRTVIGAGEAVAVDVIVSGPRDLRGYQIAVDATGGAGGRLRPVDTVIDADRSDHLFGDRTPYTAIDRAGQRIAQALGEGGVDAGQRRYLGTYTFRASRDAQGLYHVALRDAETALVDSVGATIGIRGGGEASILVRSRGLDRTSTR